MNEQEELVPLNVYGIGIYHPKNWNIFVNPNSKFTFNEGFIKIDKVTSSKKAAVSLSIRWAKMKEDIDVDDYVKELNTEFKRKEKKSRNKDNFRIIEKNNYTTNETNFCLLENEFIANHSIYRIFGKDEKVRVLQMIFYSSATGRMVVASMSTTEEEMKNNKSFFTELLFTLQENVNKNDERKFA